MPSKTAIPYAAGSRSGPRRVPAALLMVTAMLVASVQALSPAPASAHAGPDPEPGLGAYGADGPISRDLLPEHAAERVSDQAITLAQAPALAAARASWDVELDFVSHVYYQLRFRSKTDYLSTAPRHLGTVLRARPQNLGIDTLGLYLTDAEAGEFARRQARGDRIPLLRAALGEPDPVVEGQDPHYGPNFAGVWQDQRDGGALVVALVDPARVDEASLARLAGGEEHLRVVDVDHSWNEVEGFRDSLLEAIDERGVPAGVVIHSTSDGRKLEVFSPDPASVPVDILALVPDELVSLVEGPLPVEESPPTDTHPESEQQPGLQIELDPGGNCTWGINGHSTAWNYLVTAGHCGGATFDQFFGWTDDLEIHQNNSFHLTPGSQFVDSINIDGWDMKRVSTPQADSNCYHAVGSCIRYVQWRALHNSWEVGSDIVCASLGTTNTYECGAVLEENYSGGSGACSGSRYVRYDIDTGGGDSGTGLIGPVASPAVTIDAIHSCGSGTWGFGNTAYDVKTQTSLTWDFNCASSVVTGRSAANWATCPTFDR
jgi:hypothetical protein